MITRHNIITKNGNTIQVFFNDETNLLVVDIITKNEKGGCEIVRTTLNEAVLLSHVE